jgi:hypothetical protein
MTQLNDQSPQPAPTASGNAAIRMPVQTPAEPLAAGYLPTSIPASMPQVTEVPAASNGLAVAALILGLASIVFCWWGIAAFTMIVLAIVFGSIGIRRANAGAPQKNLAVAGLCCGIVGFIAYLVIGIVTFGLFLLI